MRTRIQRWTAFTGLILAALLSSGCGGGGGGGHHHGGGGGGNSFSCTSGTPYLGDQGGGGDLFGWCVSHSGNAFSFTDLSLSSGATNGTFTFNPTFNNLLTFNASANSGTSVEMPNTQLLVNPGNLLNSASMSANPVVLVFQQSGFCPALGTNYNFATLPKSSWTTSNPAYGTVSLAASNLTIAVSDINGNSLGSETDPYTCDPSTSLLTFTQQSDGKTRTVATSPQGLFVDKAGNGGAGLLQATSAVGGAVTTGTLLGLIYQPNSANPTRTVGFRPGGCAAALCGFDPLTSGQPSNGMTLDPGTESSAGLFTRATLVDANTDSPLVAVANTVSVNGVNKVVLYGITFNPTANTPVSVLLLEQ
jgi:hypothetical protein